MLTPCETSMERGCLSALLHRAARARLTTVVGGGGAALGLSQLPLLGLERPHAILVGQAVAARSLSWSEVHGPLAP